MPRIYFPGIRGKGEIFDLGGDNLRYVKSVLRMKKGDQLVLFDGAGWEHVAVIKNFSADGINLEVIGKNRIQDESPRITLLQALPKANKMDSIVRKATELGAHTIIPFRSARSIPQLTTEKARARVSRWRSIATEAARQCGRADIPGINDVLSIEEMPASAEEGTLKIIFWEEESERGIKQILRDKRYEGTRDITVMIGPEGGFSREEVASAVKRGFISASLGRNVLKVETAAVTIISIIQYELGIFGGEPDGGKL
ncbi:MAG: 16S rRNA (uracil(1498)-N(3))-methyltransferase [Syntrophales bacterium]